MCLEVSKLRVSILTRAPLWSPAERARLGESKFYPHPTLSPEHRNRIEPREAASEKAQREGSDEYFFKVKPWVNGMSKVKCTQCQIIGYRNQIIGCS